MLRKGTRFNRFGLLGLATSVVFGAIYANQSRKTLQHNKDIIKRLQGDSHTLTQAAKIALPWQYNLAKWEGTKVTLDGYFKEDRFFVARQKQGKQGYLVFAPFITHQKKISLKNEKRQVQTSVIVCLGWVPKESKSTITRSSDPVPLTEFSEQTHPNYLLIEDGFNRNPQLEDLYLPLTTITGYIKSGEKRNILKGLNNWHLEGYYRFIDLNLISRVFRLNDIDATSSAYIERVVTEQQAQTLPIPSTLKSAVEQVNQSVPTIYDNPMVYTGVASILVGLLF